MKTSERGIEVLEHEEGVVLRAYRCPAGKWTIGAGITSAAGVGPVRAGMVITRSAARAMLAEALERRYEPSVAGAMPTADQAEVDAGVLFHWNTGAIRRASWVKLWCAGAPRDLIAAKLKLWTKGGGRVLPGLVARREREARLLLDGVYPSFTSRAKATPTTARWGLMLTVVEKALATASFYKLGYQLGVADGDPLASEVRRFQEDHGLTADGIIGRATLSALQRRIDARAKAQPAAALSGGTAVATAGAQSAPDTVDLIAAWPYALPALAALSALWALYLAWSYRDVIAAKIARPFPRIAALLRSI